MRRAAGARPPPLFEFATPMPFVELQKMLDEANAWGLYCYDKGCYVDELSDDVIDAVTEHFPKKTSPLSLVLFYRLDAAFSRVAEDATAFSGGRSPRFAVFMIGVCPVPEMLPGERDWVRSMADAARGPSAARRLLRQRDHRLRRGELRRDGLRAGEVRAAGADQDEVRPPQPLPEQRQHRAGTELRGQPE